jgi:hypothetical protein
MEHCQILTALFQEQGFNAIPTENGVSVSLNRSIDRSEIDYVLNSWDIEQLVTVKRRRSLDGINSYLIREVA